MTESQQGVMRYRMLETVREYTSKHLLESGANVAVQMRHRDYFLALAAELCPLLDGPQQKACLDRLEAENDNLRLALESCKTAAGELKWRMALALCRYWEIRGYYSEGLSYFSDLLQHREGVSPLLLAQTLYAAGRLSRLYGDFYKAYERAEQSLTLFRAAGDFNNVANVLKFSGMVQMYRENSTDGLHRYQVSRRLFTRLKERRGLADVLDLLGYVQLRETDIGGAVKLFAESMKIYRELDDKDRIAHVLIGLAVAVRMQGRGAALASC